MFTVYVVFLILTFAKCSKFEDVLRLFHSRLYGYGILSRISPESSPCSKQPTITIQLEYVGIGQGSTSMLNFRVHEPSLCEKLLQKLLLFLFILHDDDDDDINNNDDNHDKNNNNHHLDLMMMMMMIIMMMMMILMMIIVMMIIIMMLIVMIIITTMIIITLIMMIIRTKQQS